MKKFIFSLIPLAALTVACNSVKIEQPVRYGELSISLAGEPVVEVETRSESGVEVATLDKTSNDAKNYTVRIFDSSSYEQQGKDVSYYEFQPQTLKLGTYYVTAENCTEAEAETGNGKMRLYGKSADVTLSAETLSQSATVNCTVANAKVTVEFDSSLTGKFTDLKVVLTGGTTQDRSLKIDESTVDKEAWFNPSTLSYTISGTFTQLSKYIELTGTRTLAAKDNIKILVKVNTENGQLSIATINVDTSVNTETPITGEFNPYN